MIIRDQWKKWFAWRPVNIRYRVRENGIKYTRNKWVWLENVYRKKMRREYSDIFTSPISPGYRIEWCYSLVDKNKKENKI